MDNTCAASPDILPAATCQTTAAVRLPPEILLKIIRAALTSSLLSSTLVVHGQFAQLPTTCSGCVYRRLACVDHSWRSFAREILCKDVVLAAGCGSAERDEQVLKRLETDSHCALGVRSIDASLRGAHGGWIPVPAPALAEDGDVGGASGSESTISGMTTRQARWERWHEQCMARERFRFLRIVSLCTELTTLDIDVDFFHDVPSNAHVLPTTIRHLTLRNAGAIETFAILQALPRLESLTLRLALDWRLPTSHDLKLSGLPRLRHFELSTTAFGKPCLQIIRLLLGDSQETLTSLSFRNKAASEETLEAFKLVAADVVQQFAPRLEKLTIKDLPRHRGLSTSGCLLVFNPVRSQMLTADTTVVDTTAGRSWFPSRTVRLPQLRHLHLTGLLLPNIDFLTRSVILPDQQLKTLTIEDFHALSLVPFVEALEGVPALQGLQELAVAVSREGEIARLDSEGWQEQRRRIEEWCARPKGSYQRGTDLLASWNMVKVEGCTRW
ncbi:hypothetical protein JCM10908_005424 [Rhodotorula pacifica]|uniref:uncharacterized protein n=1 Tax=Rhodotorula pacifica TaxID=1495444 RepID=UPI00316F52BB